MALITTQKLYIDIERGVAYSRWNNFSTAPTPVFYDGDTAKLELHLVRQTSSSTFPMESVDFPGATITAAVGTPGSTAVASGTSWTALSAPQATISSNTLTLPRNIIGGSFSLAIYKTTSPAIDTAVTQIAYNASAADIKTRIETAVNAVSGWSTASATVTPVGSGVFAINLTAKNSTTTYDLTEFVTIDESGFLFPSGYVGELAFTGSGVDTLLGSNASVESTFEVQVVDSSKYQTYIQIPCIIKKQVTTP